MLDTIYERPASIEGADRGHEGADHRGLIRFGGFEVLPSARMLRRGKTPIEIGGRAFDLLMTLLGSPGEIVPKERIMQQVWPTTTVDESNLRFQMTCLRRILGSESRRIKTIPGRGYIFIVHDRDAEEASWLTASGRAERPPIVIIDGDPESRAHLSRLLAAAGARVESFATVTAFLAESKIVERPGRTAPTEAMAA